MYGIQLPFAPETSLHLQIRISAHPHIYLYTYPPIRTSIFPVDNPHYRCITVN